jgi:hypothetical protein
MQLESLADIRYKLSIIYKHIQSMHNELRYQTKIHTISETLSKKIKILHLLPHFFFFFGFMLEKKKTEKQQKHAYGEKK